MSTKGQTINDRLNAAKHTIAGQSLARCICKATTEELMKPKKKHLDYLAASTYETNVSMMHLTNLLIERTGHSNWVVVYKALITVHHLMCYGSERFTQYLASSNYSVQLDEFLVRNMDKGYSMSIFIRRYSDYINQKALTYRTLAIDLCRAKSGKDNVLRTMPIERLLQTLPVIDKQMEILMKFGYTENNLNNGVIVACFTLLFHDAIRLFASYNDGIINLFEKFFDLNKKMCREAFECYKKFLVCTDGVSEIIRVAEAIDLHRGELLDFKRAPSSLLETLEQHLVGLESNKKRDKSVTVDTKSVVFPSFSVSNDSEFAPRLMENISQDFEAQLAFSSEESEFDKAIKLTPSNSKASQDNSNIVINLQNVKAKSPFDQEPPPTPLSPPVPGNLAETLALGQKFDNPLDSLIFNDLDVKSNANKSPMMSSDFTSGSNDILDMNPPSFMDGSLLKPEGSLRMTINPSIDPITQKKLIQIKGEQVANRQQWQSSNSNTSSSGSNSLQGGYKSSQETASNARQKRESMFEELEKAMRQSLQKT